MDALDLWVIGIDHAEQDLEPKVVGGPGDDAGENGFDTVVFNLRLNLLHKVAFGAEDVGLGNCEFSDAEEEAGHALGDEREIAIQVGTEEAARPGSFFLELEFHLFVGEFEAVVLHGEQECFSGWEVVDEATFADTGLFGYFVEGEGPDAVGTENVVGGGEDGFVGEC